MDDDDAASRLDTRRRVTFLLGATDPTTTSTLRLPLPPPADAITIPLLLTREEQDFQKLEQDLETPNIIYFEEFLPNEHGHLEDRYGVRGRRSCCPCCRNSWLCWEWRSLKMWCCCTGRGRLCLCLLVVKLVILGVIFPVVHLQEEPHNFDHGYPQPDDNHYNGRNHHGGDDGGPDYAESVHVQPPTDSGGGGGGGDDDNILVVRHDGDESGGGGGGGETVATSTTTITSGDAGGGGGGGAGDDDGGGEADSTAATAATTSGSSSEAAKSSSAITTDEESGKVCQNSNPNPLENKLESIISAISNIHQSIEKMETLMQGTLVEDQRNKCISAILSGNGTLAQKHWVQIMKYISSPEKVEATLANLVKEAYNGVPDRIAPLASFIAETSQCSGFATLYSEMTNYGHVFGGHPYIFPVAIAVRKSCPHLSTDLLPSTLTTMLGGSFLLQNKLNRGYLYYAKRCVARHYYHCLDVLTKRVPSDEFDALEERSDEWGRYRWRLNVTDESANFFFILNEDKYLPYRLQDLNNSPRFKMEEASSNFEKNMAHFQIGLETEDEVVIRVKDTDMFLEGEEIKVSDGSAEVLLHSFYKAEKAVATDGIKWIVGGRRNNNGGESGGGGEKARIGRSPLKFPLLIHGRS
ncbi:uncharacterized protein LOC110843897 isoform X2 [Folsomia candida]|uniref:Uncharacterized protein n=1 Tax=Folsomia candida TaxID=158441 RepID=A0A226EQI3_FOLCA|nr:uncharacterized protein LOC110843897 isoform X2 [Folsomia candida]OXA59520.1 hypothetical protein Fcan01_04048 [Folsomia candida]